MRSCCVASQAAGPNDNRPTVGMLAVRWLHSTSVGTQWLYSWSAVADRTMLKPPGWIRIVMVSPLDVAVSVTRPKLL